MSLQALHPSLKREESEDNQCIKFLLLLKEETPTFRRGEVVAFFNSSTGGGEVRKTGKLPVKCN
jgi:hypothetical protein